MLQGWGEYHYHWLLLLLGILSTPQDPFPASFPLKSNSSSACQPLNNDAWNMNVLSFWDGLFSEAIILNFRVYTHLFGRGFAINLDQEVWEHGCAPNLLPEIGCMMTMMTIPPKNHHKGYMMTMISRIYSTELPLGSKPPKLPQLLLDYICIQGGQLCNVRFRFSGYFFFLASHNSWFNGNMAEFFER